MTLQQLLETQEDLNKRLQDEIKLLEEIVVTMVSDSEYSLRISNITENLQTPNIEKPTVGLIDAMNILQESLHNKIENLNNIRQQLSNIVYKPIEITNPKTLRNYMDNI